MRVLILKQYPEAVFKIIKQCFPAEWTVNCINQDDSPELIESADIIIPSHIKVDRIMIDKASNLKIIQTGAGFDNVDIEYCRVKGIRVMNAPAVNTNEVSEHVFAFIFKWFKKIEELDRSVRKNGWSDEKTGKAFSDLVLGIIGYGNIGKKTAETAEVLGMKVLVYSKYGSDRNDGKVFTETLDELLSISDIVTLHTSSTKDKINMISDREFGTMKKNAFFINTARGDLVDEDALYRALKDKKIAGAALDVFKKEPLPMNSPLRDLDNIILTPHNAGEPDMVNSYRKRFSFFYRNIEALLEKGKPAGIIV